MINNGFNIFRVSCWLNDLENTNYHEVIKSIVCDKIFQIENQGYLLSDCHTYLSKEHRVALDIDDLNEILSDDPAFQLISSESDLEIYIEKEKFESLAIRASAESIEHYLDLFLKKKVIDDSTIVNKLISLFYTGIYENINSFSTENLKSLIRSSSTDKFEQTEIDLFNDFIDWSHSKKNEVIYSTFSKAVEFAILTSGVGLTEVSTKLFKDKKYYLDANIIIRAMGVGGEERKHSLLNLLDSCIHEGITFEYSQITHEEVIKKISGVIYNLKKELNPDNSELMQEIILDTGININDSFTTHFFRLRREGKVSSPDNYDLYLRSELLRIAERYHLKGEPVIHKIGGLELTSLKNKLFDAKKNMGIGYTRMAAKADAINVLYVRKIRGYQNLDYDKVKSFYLTTDRSLCRIVAKNNRIPETIMPSQLFLLHNSQKRPAKEDIVDFVRFLKRRTTDFKLDGKEVLEYIDEVRKLTNDSDRIKQVIIGYANKQFNESISQIERKKKKAYSFKEYSQTSIDKKLAEGEQTKNAYDDILNRGIEKLGFLSKITKRLFIGIEIIISLSIATIIYSIENRYVLSLGIAVLLFIISQVAEKYVFDSIQLKSKVRRKIFEFFTKRSTYYKNLSADRIYTNAYDEYKEEL